MLDVRFGGGYGVAGSRLGPGYWVVGRGMLHSPITTSYHYKEHSSLHYSAFNFTLAAIIFTIHSIWSFDAVVALLFPIIAQYPLSLYTW